MKKEYDLTSLKKRKAKVKTSSDAAKVQLSIRLDGSDLAQLREDADRLGIPYQTLLGSILHQYVTGELVEKKTVAMLKNLRSA